MGKRCINLTLNKAVSVTLKMLNFIFSLFLVFVKFYIFWDYLQMPLYYKENFIIMTLFCFYNMSTDRYVIYGGPESTELSLYFILVCILRRDDWGYHLVIGSKKITKCVEKQCEWIVSVCLFMLLDKTFLLKSHL